MTENIFTGSLTKTVARLSDGTELSLINLADSGAYRPGEQIFLFWDQAKGVVMKS